MSDTAIGIDLGTTYCCVAVVVNGEVEIIPNREQGTRLTPSYVAYPPGSKGTYGTVAKEQAFKFPEDTIFDAKRIIGRPWDDPVLQQDIKTWPFEVKNFNNSPRIKTGDKTRYPQEISAKLLSKLTRNAEAYLGKSPGDIRKAVITVPAYFSEGQRRATIEAGQSAGLDVLTILNEPTAAAIAYKFQRRDSKEPRTALVYDLGGGTFDVAIVRVTEEKVETLGVDGDTHLGGQDFDNLLVQHCAEEFKKDYGVNLLDGSKDSARPLARLRYQCEKAKQSLSAAEDVTVDVQSIYKGKDLTVDVTREKFESLIKPLLEKSIEIVQRAIKDAKGIKGKRDIKDAILIGGSTRIPLCTQMLQKFFDGQMVNCAINPDEAVAYGAAVQASVLNAEEKNERCEIERFKIQDVTPKSIGIKVIPDKFSPIISKNQQYPCKIARSDYYTTHDNQTSLMVRIFQGENPVATKNYKLGEFRICGIPPGPAGSESIVVTMEINKNGILNVKAESVSSGSSNAITIEDDRIRMPADVIQRLVEELRQQTNKKRQQQHQHRHICRLNARGYLFIT